MEVKNISLAWVTVSDIAKAKNFFVNTLGMKVHQDSPEHGWLELTGKEGEMTLGVAQANNQAGIQAGTNAVVTLTVADVVAAKAELETKGVTFIGDIIEIPGHVKMALLADADGNKFQLVQLFDR